MKNNKLLWVDDEIEMLRAHIIFLSEKGYEVDIAANGEDAIDMVSNNQYDLIFLDEMMAGMGGLEVLSRIKEINSNIPVIMVTKSEEESLMNNAIGGKIDGYLIKPVLPSQILMACKRHLQGKQIKDEFVAKDYLIDFAKIGQKLNEPMNYQDWTDVYIKLVNWSKIFDEHKDVDLRQTLNEQYKECNKIFSKFVERNYTDWVDNIGEPDMPTLSPEIFDNYVAPHLKDSEGPVFYFILDCMRADQWNLIKEHLLKYFNISTEYYYSILPTATPYSRNSLFSGLFPLEIQEKHPDLWVNGNEDDERSMNKNEKNLLQRLLDSRHIKLKTDLKYMKIIDPEVGRSFEQNVKSHHKTHFMAVVVNFLDMIAHGRSDSDLLKEIAPDESAYRSLTNSWFEHSSLFGTLKVIASMKNAKIILTTDHGSIRCLRGAKVLGDREASKNLRFKYGRNLKAEDKNAVFVKNHKDYMLPDRGIIQSYIIAKEDYYFVYPTEYHKYLSYYKDTFQHGGISMEEMILPVATLESKI